MELFTMTWVDLVLNNKGRLTTLDGPEININWPSFTNRQEADQYLVDNDIRASIN
jgi:hypothetical protein